MSKSLHKIVAELTARLDALEAKKKPAVKAATKKTTTSKGDKK